MITYVYVVYDTVAKEAGPLFQAKNDDVAKRNVRNLVDREHVNPLEMKLYHVGSFDADDMTLGIVPEPVEVDFMEVKNE